MDIETVMQAVADRLDTIVGLRIRPYPAGSVTPPAAIVSFPERIDYDQTYQRGCDRVTLPVVLVVGKAADRAAWKSVTSYAAGSGSKSIKSVLESGVYTAFDVVRVPRVEFDTVTIGATEYFAALFTLDIVGHGS
jgi:hypothetical protein